MDIEKLRIAVKKENIEWRKHIFQRMLERNIDRADLKTVIMEGEMIENYVDDKSFPSALFFKVVIAAPTNDVGIASMPNGTRSVIVEFVSD